LPLLDNANRQDDATEDAEPTKGSNHDDRDHADLVADRPTCGEAARSTKSRSNPRRLGAFTIVPVSFGFSVEEVRNFPP